MNITQNFRVDHPVEVVWNALADVPLVADCLPGAELTESQDGRHYQGKMKVKLGPISAAFSGKATVDRDEGMRRGTVEGTGLDRGSGSRAKARMTYRVMPTEDGTGTEVRIDAEIVLSGALAQFGRSDIIKDISARLTDSFVQNLQLRLASGAGAAQEVPAPKEIDAIGLLLSVLWKRFSRFIGRLLGRKASP